MLRAVRLVLSVIIGVGLAVSWACADAEQPLQITGVEFCYPVPDAQDYHLRIGLVAEESVTLSKVEVNGNQADIISFLGEDGQPEMPRLAAGGRGVARLAFNWIGGDDCRVKVTAGKEAGGEAEVEWVGKAPKGGYWNPAWPHHKPVLIREDWGVERVAEPVEITVGFSANEIGDPEAEIRVVEVSPAGEQREIPSQVYDIGRVESPEHPDLASLSCTVALLADVPAYGQKTYLIFYGNKEASKPAYPTDLSLSGEKPGFTVENEWYRLGFSPKNGQLLSVSPKADPALNWLGYKGRETMHLNPDVYPADRPWTHVSDWNPPPTSAEVAGPILIRTKRFGPLPGAPETFASVTYKFSARNPWLMSSSLLEFKEDMGVLAVRSGEMVFDVGTFSQAAWRERSGKLGEVEMLDRFPYEEGKLKALRAILEGDVRWVCMFNPGDSHGIAALNLAYFNGSFEGGDVAAQEPNIYILNSGYAYIYWCRSSVYPFFSSISSAPVLVPKGSMFTERTAYVAFRMGDSEETRFDELDSLHFQLTHPLRVMCIAWTE